MDAKILILGAAILAASLIIAHAIVERPAPEACSLIVPEDDDARARRLAANIERHQYIADRKRAWEIVAKEWKGEK